MGFANLCDLIEGKGNFPPLGEFNIHVSENADTGNLSDVHDTRIYIYTGYTGSGNGEFILGNCSVNFKQIIVQGGGSFTGSLRVTGGSAMTQDPNVFTNLPALTITGDMDIASATATLRIQGKVYF